MHQNALAAGAFS